MSTETGTFHVGDILSVLQPLLVSPRGIDGVADLLTFMAGEPLDPHQYGRVADECKASLAAQFPDIASLAIPAEALADRDTGLAWMAALPGGDTREVAPLAPEDHTHLDPEAEAVAKYGRPFRSHLRGTPR